MAKVAEKVPSRVGKLLLPEIREIVREETSNQMKLIDAKTTALDSKLEERTKALDAKIDEKFKTLKSEISSLRNEIK